MGYCFLAFIVAKHQVGAFMQNSSVLMPERFLSKCGFTFLQIIETRMLQLSFFWRDVKEILIIDDF